VRLRTFSPAALLVLVVACGREADPVTTAIPPVSPTPTPSVGRVEVAHAERIDEGEWSVPALKARVLLARRAQAWCLSAPEIEPGIACTPNLRYGVAIGFRNAFFAVVAPDAAKRPLLELPDGTSQTLEPAPGGLIALADPPPGSSLTLYDKDGGSFVESTTQGG
jgi:hypothetical protein